MTVHDCQITQAHVYPSYPFPGTRCRGNRHRQGQIPPASLAVELGCTLFDGLAHLLQNAVLALRGSKRHPDPPCVGRETGGPEVARPLNTQVLVVEAGWQDTEPFHPLMGGHIPNYLIHSGGWQGCGHVLANSPTSEPLRSTSRHKVVCQCRCALRQFPVQPVLSAGRFVETKSQGDGLHLLHLPSAVAPQCTGGWFRQTRCPPWR